MMQVPSAIQLQYLKCHQRGTRPTARVSQRQRYVRRWWTATICQSDWIPRLAHSDFGVETATGSRVSKGRVIAFVDSSTG